MSDMPIYIVDIIGDVVTATKNAVIATIRQNEVDAIGGSLMQTISYSRSSFDELIETLAQKDKPVETRNAKYPLIHLVRDFSEDRGKVTGIYAEVNLNIIIIHQTENTYKIEDREEKVFKPVLYPIYYEFMKQLAKHKLVHVDSYKMIPHRKWDRAFWGNRQLYASKNKLNDYVDAIELQNINLKIDFSNC